MKTIVIACRTLEAELDCAMRSCGCRYPVLWLESGSHNHPAQLHRTLQELLRQTDAERALLAMGLCGGALDGLYAETATLIVPRVDDCISLLLGSQTRREALGRQYAAYFLTGGWLRGERNLWAEYCHAAEKYGPERAARITERMVRGYRTLALLDTGAEPLAPLLEQTKTIAQTLRLQPEVLQGESALLRSLLTGPWEEPRFLIREPGQPICAEEFRAGQRE